MLVEQTLTAVKSNPHTFKLSSKVTHLGNDLHGTSGQEFPAVYTNRDYRRFVYYNGSDPWTSGALTVTAFQELGLTIPPWSFLGSGERWWIRRTWGSLSMRRPRVRSKADSSLSIPLRAADLTTIPPTIYRLTSTGASACDLSSQRKAQNLSKSFRSMSSRNNLGQDSVK